MADNWADRAACRGLSAAESARVFFVDKPGAGMYRQAREFCAACPVAADCLDHALRNNEAGYWGGTTEDQRAELRRRRGIRLRGNSEMRA